MSKIDKLRSTYPVEIKFFSGEQPSAAKLSAVSSQSKAGLNIIEKAVGDIWGTGPSEKGLHVTNLGRVLGDTKYSNPALFNVGDTRFWYIENLADKWQGKTTGYLTFRPADSTASAGDALTAIKFSDGNLASVTHVTPAIPIESAVDSNSTKVFVDTSTGKFRTGKPIASGDLVGYWVDPTEWIQGSEDFYPSIIPDPRCDVSLLTIQGDASSGYYFEVPNRASIESDSADPFHELSNLPDRRPKRCVLATLDLNDEANIAAATYFTETPRFWDSSTAALDFHKYSWPEKLTSGLLAPGSIHLWDNNDNGVVEGLDFTVDSGSTSKINITDTKGRLNWALTLSPAHDFYLITHGSSLSRTVWSLVAALANHDHTGVRYNESNLNHSVLLDANSTVNKDSVIWEKSAFSHDDHVQYLHRDGPSHGIDDRDLNKGAMLGDLIIGQTTPTDNNYLGDLATYNSNKIWFGDNTSGTNPCIYGKIGGAVVLEDNNPRLDFLDKAASDTSFRLDSNGKVLKILGDHAGNDVYDTEYARFQWGGVVSSAPLVEFGQRISWNVSAETDGSSNNSAKVLMELGAANDDVRLVSATTQEPTGDGFRIMQELSPFFDPDSTLSDYLVFEKTDSTPLVSGGGIAFTTNVLDVPLSIHTRRSSLLMNSDGTILLNASIPQKKTDTTVTLMGTQHPTGLDVSNKFKATQISTARHLDHGSSAIAEELIFKEQVGTIVANGIITATIDNYWPVAYTPVSASVLISHYDSSGNSTDIYETSDEVSSVAGITQAGHWYLNRATGEMTLALLNITDILKIVYSVDDKVTTSKLELVTDASLQVVPITCAVTTAGNQQLVFTKSDGGGGTSSTSIGGIQTETIIPASNTDITGGGEVSYMVSIGTDKVVLSFTPSTELSSNLILTHWCVEQGSIRWTLINRHTVNAATPPASWKMVYMEG